MAPFHWRIDRAEGLDILRGLEGVTARIYFEGFRRQLRDTPFRFERRAYHPAPDPINALLSLGHTPLLGALVRSSGFRAGIVESAVGSLAEPGNYRARLGVSRYSSR